MMRIGFSGISYHSYEYEGTENSVGNCLIYLGPYTMHGMRCRLWCSPSLKTNWLTTMAIGGIGFGKMRFTRSRMAGQAAR